MKTFSAALCGLLILASGGRDCFSAGDRFALEQDKDKGHLQVTLDGREAFTYLYADPAWALPHYYPLNTPSGKNLVVQKKDPYPHHRAFWFGDTVERDGVRGDIYNAWYSGKKDGGKNGKTITGPPFNTGVRHVSFPQTTATAGMATIEEELVWETNRTTESFPLLDEHRLVRLHAMDDGGYLMDMTFTLKATYGDVKFVSDAVHYAWPYLRIHPEFSGENGGVITADHGATGQEATNMKPAKWIDYSNTLDGVAEGVAVYQWPDGKEHRWLTREYGTFGPRRPDELSGKPFTLKKGETLSQRAGVLVHAGDVTGGKVAEVYKRYIDGKIAPSAAE